MTTNPLERPTSTLALDPIKHSLCNPLRALSRACALSLKGLLAEEGCQAYDGGGGDHADPCLTLTLIEGSSHLGGDEQASLVRAGRRLRGAQCAHDAAKQRPGL